MSAIARAIAAFGRFWWDFLIGDTPELFVATILIVAAALVLRHDHIAAIAVLPVLAVVMLAASALRGRRRHSDADNDP